MSKVAVVYWSSTGNTEAMANAVAGGIKEKGGEAGSAGRYRKRRKTSPRRPKGAGGNCHSR